MKARRIVGHCLPHGLRAAGTELQLRRQGGYTVMNPHHPATLFVDGDEEWRRQAGFPTQSLQFRRQPTQARRVGEVVAEDQHRADLLIDDEAAQALGDARSREARRHHLADGHVERQERRARIWRGGW